MLWRWHIGISHSKVDDVFTGMAGIHLDLIDSRKDIGRQSI
jgi:hypothetical protein